MKQKLGYLFFFLAVILVVNSCEKNEAVTTKDELKQQEIIPVEVHKVQKTLWTEYVSSYGNIKTKDKVDIFSKMPGKIIKLLVKEGQLVQNGTLVAIVDRDEVGSTYKPVEVKATINGKVEQIHLKEGSQVSSAAPILSIAKQEELKIVATPFETDIAKLRLGQKVFISMDAFPTREFYGKVSYINPNIRTNSGKGEVEITFDKDNNEVLAGMFGRVKILIAQHSTLSVVQEALKTIKHKYAVYLVVKGTARLSYVEVGAKIPDAIEIKQGISLGDTVITFASEKLRDGSRVKIAGGNL